MMKYTDLRDFIAYLESQGELKRIDYPISPYLEMTEIADRVLKSGGPALLFEKPKGYSMPVLCNLFGTVKRIALAIGSNDIAALRELGELLAFLREPLPPKNFRHLWDVWPKYKRLLTMSPKMVSPVPCQEICYTGRDVSLDSLPIMHCWPQDVAPLITWGLTVTKGPYKDRQNIGIYRLQKQASNKLIMRWLPHRGGAIDFRDWQEVEPKKPFPVVIALGADPSTILSAVTPIPDTFSEYAFAGLFRGGRSEVAKALSCDLNVPAHAEIILEGYVHPEETAVEGPHGDHTGYYNEVGRFPVMTVTHITQRKHAIYHSTYTGRPQDEPAILGLALNEVFIPILQKQFPEIVDFYLPPEGCSYRVAVVTIKKQYAGHAKRIMMGVWSYLRQFMYTKFVIVCDSDINARDWKDVIWAISTRMDPHRDTIFIDNTPIDYLDFASPIPGLGSKMGFDATSKWPGETMREWGTIIKKDPDIVAHVDEIWHQLGI